MYKNGEMTLYTPAIEVTHCSLAFWNGGHCSLVLGAKVTAPWLAGAESCQKVYITWNHNFYVIFKILHSICKTVFICMLRPTMDLCLRCLYIKITVTKIKPSVFRQIFCLCRSS